MDVINRSEQVRKICMDMLTSSNNSVYLGDLIRKCRSLVDGWNNVDLIKLRVRVISSLKRKDSGFEVYKQDGRVLIRSNKLWEEFIDCSWD